MAGDENLKVRIRQEMHLVLATKIFGRLRIWASYVAMVLAGVVSFLFFRFPFNFARVRGRNHIPRRGERVLFVSNHTTMYDSILIGVAAYRGIGGMGCEGRERLLTSSPTEGEGPAKWSNQ